MVKQHTLEIIINKTRKHCTNKIRKFKTCYEDLSYNGWEVSAYFRELFPKTWRLLSKIGKTHGGVVPMKICYSFLHGVRNIPACKICGGEVKFGYTVRRYKVYCSHKCSNSCPEKLLKRQKTNLERFGARNYIQSKKGQKAYRKAMLKNYGAPNPFCKGTTIRKELEEYFIKTYGGPSPMCSEEIRNKTNEQFEGGNPMKDAKHLETYLDNRYKQKQIKICGETLTVVGFEHYAIDAVRDRIKKIRVRASEMPKLEYLGNDGKVHRYYPDMRILSKTDHKYLVEVKSTFTLQRDLKTNLKKFKVAKKWCAANDYTFLLAIGYRNGDVKWVKNPTKTKIEKLIS